MSGWYAVLVGLVGLERLAELKVARRNLRWSLARGGVESGGDHYPALVALHVGLLAGCLLEPAFFDRPFLPVLGWPMLVLAAAAQGLRWWCIRTLGPQWNTRVVVIPGLSRVSRGPYRFSWLPHPNYLAVAVEGFALPLVHSAWMTALAFTVLNIPVTALRLHTENTALRALDPREA